VAHEQGGEAVGFQSAGQGGPGGEVAGLGLDADLHDGHGAHGPTVRVSASVVSASTASGLRGAPPHTVRRRGAHSVVSQRSAIEQDCPRWCRPHSATRTAPLTGASHTGPLGADPLVVGERGGGVSVGRSRCLGRRTLCRTGTQARSRPSRPRRDERDTATCNAPAEGSACGTRSELRRPRSGRASRHTDEDHSR